MRKLKIGEIHYANCTPIYTILKELADCSGYEFVTGEPARLNSLLASGGVDVSSSSSIEFARHQSEYLIIPDISISSTGDVGSILLFSKKPVESLGGSDIAVSSASATSTVLLKSLFRHHYRLDAAYTPCEPVLKKMLDGRDAALLIGDEALKERIRLSEADGLFVYDLGGVWHGFTGLPFVYALWMVRVDSAREVPELSLRFSADIVRARDASMGVYSEIAARSPESKWMGEAGLVSYWNAMSYELTPQHIAGLSLFYGYAAELGEAPAGVSPAFL